MPAQTDCASPPPAKPLDLRLAWQRFDACNRELVTARRVAAGAGADRLIAEQSPNPSLTAGVGAINPALGIGPGGPTSKTIDTSIRVDQVIERGGKLALRRRNAERLVAAAELDVAEVRRQQGAAMLLAMVDLASAMQRVVLLTEVTHLYDESARANAQRLARGDIARMDVQRQAIDALRAQADLRQAQGDIQRARVAVASALAWEAYASSLAVDLSMLDIDADIERAPDPQERADVRAARRRLEAAAATRDLARAQATADVTLGAQFDHYPSSANNPNGTGNTFAISASIPFLVRHRYEGEIAKAANDYYAADENVRRALASAASEWSRIAQDLATALARWRLLNDQVAPQAEAVVRAAETGYARGALGVLDLLEARRVARQTGLDLLAARADVARAHGARQAWLLAQDK
ncbi:MAG: TolC family protein [Pseudomonadota bacterium]|nr:TolC family protein [Pseudomonadota bacterium]